MSGAYATVRCIVVMHNADQTSVVYVFRKLNTSERALCNTFEWSFKYGIARNEDPVQYSVRLLTYHNCTSYCGRAVGGRHISTLKSTVVTLVLSRSISRQCSYSASSTSPAAFLHAVSVHFLTDCLAIRAEVLAPLVGLLGHAVILVFQPQLHNNLHLHLQSYS